MKRESELEVLENPDALADRLLKSESYVERHKNLFIGIFVAIAAAVVGGFLYYQNREAKNAEALSAMFQAEYYFEADSLNKALNGDGQYAGFKSVAEEYGSTKAGNLANFYAGTILLKQGKYQDALNYLEEFNSDDLLLQARAYSLQGDAQLELGKAAEAASLYKKAAEHKANDYFSPQYLMKAAMAHETANQPAEAVDVYDRIINDYPLSAEVADAKKYKARAEGLAKK
ncbi:MULTISPECIES: tetratricopeptide repeat protein [Rufibacter]|uniref:Putative negative regulator of RcsB-dependent stress response n=1 Tax=Rufibacter quisquiliarum TaxID=1549639 RepID=A0A839GAM8_9BACT|nr:MULTISPECIES: tetratricopeptide repeat protein [Rufibacter]MBA9075982.1 putative negative regulator of RcsB-dependent stress response [Rufibacter quisquiliarum]